MKPSDLKLKSAEFRREREKSWKELDKLLLEVEQRGHRSLSAQQLERLPVLHRAAVSALSVARAISLDRALLRYLESLTARSFICVYGVKRHALQILASFFLRRLPGAVWRARYHVLVAALCMLAGALVGFAVVRGDQDLYHAIVPEDIAQGRSPTTSTEELLAVLYEPETDAGQALTHFAAFLFSHNAQIGLMSFAVGVAGGLPVFFILFFNGLILGGMSALYHSRGLSLDWWGWVLPHGVTELLAIVLCGAAGLVLAQGVIFPGRHLRLVNLAIKGREAGQIVFGCVVMLFLAALLEGFFRQWVSSVGVRYTVAGVSAVGWSVYFVVLGRRAGAGA